MDRGEGGGQTRQVCGTPLVSSVNILVVALPRLFADVVRAAGGAGVRVVDELADADELVEDVDRTDTAVVVVGDASGELPAACRALLKRRPHTKVIVVRADRAAAQLFELRPSTTVLRDLTPRSLVDALTAAVQDPAGTW